jgi:hypothetical protein
MGLGQTFTKSIVREIGRNVGKGLSNDMFGDWHSTPVRVAGSKANKEGWDLSYVKEEEYDISVQPLWTPNWGWFGTFFYNYIICSVFFIFLSFLWYPLFTIKDFLRKKTTIYAKVPMRRTDRRTKLGYRELNQSSYVELKSKRLLTDQEKKRSKIAGGLELLAWLCSILTYNFLWTGSFFDFSSYVEIFSLVQEGSGSEIIQE